MPSYRFGKHPRKCDYRTLRFKNYVTAALPPPPASLNLLDRICTKVGTSDPTQLFPLDGNDTLGDCTIAALAHAITTYRGLCGTKDIMQKQAVVKLYYISPAASTPALTSWMCSITGAHMPYRMTRSWRMLPWIRRIIRMFSRRYSSLEECI